MSVQRTGKWQSGIGLAAVWAALALSTTVTAVAVPPQVNGKLGQIGPFRVLWVWGSPEEMGFAHGYLVGPEFVRQLNESIPTMPPQERARYDQARTRLRDCIHVPDAALAEIEGMLRGIEAAFNGTPRFEALGRPLRLDDLILHNAADTLRAFGCSGFVVWGLQAGKAGVITARNFDYIAPRYMVEGQLILVRQPAGRRQVATITYPALLLAFTGFNDAGVCTFMHDGTGRMIRTPRGKYTPLGLVLTRLLETCAPADAHARAESALRDIGPYPFSYLVRVVTPRVSASAAKPVRVFRLDATGLSENPVGDAKSITTNHYMTLDFKPVQGADDWSLSRYDTLANRLNGTVTDSTAWNLLKAVVSRGGFPTLHSLVVYPELRRLDLAFATWADDNVAVAPEKKATAIRFDQLFVPRN